MSILAELNGLLTPILPVETGIFSGVPPDEYIVITPMTDSFELYCDDRPLSEVSEVRLSLFTKGSYTARAREITAVLIDADFTVTYRRYIGLENDTVYHGYAIDVAKTYEMED